MNSTPKRTALAMGGLLLFTSSVAHGQTTIRLEAEDMTLDTYKVEALDFASNGALINLKGPGYVGNATAPFPGASGNYDITVVYHDENDGLAQLSVLIDGTTVDSWTLDFKSSESQPTPANRLTREIATGYAVSNGDEIRIDGLQGNWDHANVDYIEFVAGGPDDDVNPPIVLDFSEGKVTIDNPGYYVLDRDWTLDEDVADDPALEILADGVTIDLRGFRIEFKGHPGGILVTGDGATLRDGAVFANNGTDAVKVNGKDAQIHAMRIGTGSYTTAVRLVGASGRLSDSVISGGEDTSAVHAAGTGVTIQSNEIRTGYIAISSPYGGELTSAQITDNVISCGWTDCVAVEGTRNVIARNTFTRSPDGSAIIIAGNDNQILDNSIPHLDGGGTAIVIDGTRNVIRGNIVLPPNSDDDTWRIGIGFAQDGNYYGDNLVSAQTPFELGGTVQTDLGGNQPL